MAELMKLESKHIRLRALEPSDIDLAAAFEYARRHPVDSTIVVHYDVGGVGRVKVGVSTTTK